MSKQKELKELIKKLNWIKKDSGLGVGRLRSCVQATKKDKLRKRSKVKLSF
jgi:hypothetical protein